jgi:hypothetical protein
MNKERELNPFDAKLNNAIISIKNRCPDDYQTILDYFRLLMWPYDINPSDEEDVKAAYHKIAVVSKIIKRLGGVEKRG